MLKIVFLLLLGSSITLKDASGRIIFIERDNRSLDFFPIVHRHPEPLKEVTDLNGTFVRVIGLMDETFRPTDNATKVTGAAGEIWTLLGECLNSTLVPTSVDIRKLNKRNPFSSLIQSVLEQKQDVVAGVAGTRDNRVHYTLPIMSSEFAFYMRPILRTNESWLSSVVEYKIWLVVAGFLALITLIGWLSDGLLVTRRSRSSFMDHLFNNISVLCLQGSLPDSFQNRGKMLRIVKTIFVFLFWGFFGTFLFTKLATKIEIKPFDNVQELLENTNFTILADARVFAQGPLGWTIRDPLYKKRILLGTINSHFEKTCASNPGKYVIYAGRVSYEAHKGDCRLHRMGRTIYSVHYPAAVRKGSKLHRTIDIGILKLQEYGLMKRLLKTNLPLIFDKTPSSSNSEVEALTFSHFKYVFGLWALGMICACIIFVAEVIVWDIQEKRKEEKKKKKKKEKKERIKPVEEDIELYDFVL